MLRHHIQRVQSRRHIIFNSLPTYPSPAWGFNMGFPYLSYRVGTVFIDLPSLLHMSDLNFVARGMYSTIPFYLPPSLGPGRSFCSGMYATPFHE